MTGEPALRGVYTIAPDQPFVDALAAGIAAQYRDPDMPAKLSDVLVLLPTRRACRALADAFLRLTAGQPLLLPRLVPLGDIDADELLLALPPGGAAADHVPPPMPELQRRLLLSRLIQHWSARRTGPGSGAETAAGSRQISLDQAARLAEPLCRLLDEVATERLTFEGLAGLVPEEHAVHWQDTLHFLAIVVEQWPEILADLGTIDPAERRSRLLTIQAQAWVADPPVTPVIAAGSTGSVPATADLLAVIADLPQGAVVLPGLDRDLDDISWRALGLSHPQYGLARLLERLRVPRHQVPDWPAIGAPDAGQASVGGQASVAGHASAAGRARRRLASEMMRPAATSEAWAALPPLDATALDGVTRIDCPGSQEEAGVIALIMRRTLAMQAEHRTCALVTPDRGLARRVAAELRRWDVVIDDSAGTPLTGTPPGTFLRLTAQIVAAGAPPVPLLALLKHPLAAGGQSPGAFRAQVRGLERVVLRGPRPAAGFAGLVTAIAALGEKKFNAMATARAPMLRWAEGLAAMAAPFAALMTSGPQQLDVLLRAHIAFAEALAATHEQTDGAARLWRREDGEAAARLIAELATATADLPPLEGRHYPALLEALMAGLVVRPRYGTHPRLAILGPLEARLQHFDLMILGGLNEGTWPPDPRPDPWMSRPMRRDFGLPDADRRVGLSAHDFVQAFCAPEVVLTRALRVDGTPTVPARWLTRLEHVAERTGLRSLETRPQPWTHWQRLLDRTDERRSSRRRPAPTPPVAARPRRLSVTQIETWMRDPYAIYARHILRLRALDQIDAPADAAQYGTLIHQVLDDFIAAHPTGPLPSNAVEELCEMGREAFAPLLAQPGVWAFWWPRFERIARWF
ncbi:MAG: double-strand break repair protein AddB, partial [Alphaproteobacteria bacterium]